MNDKVNFPQGAAPLNPELLERFRQYDSKSLYWLSGYCSGLADAKSGDISVGAATSQANPANQITASNQQALKTVVLYASQSGNAQKIAEDLHQRLVATTGEVELASVADFKPKSIKDQDVILLVASTHGEGEPPDDAIDFHEFILGKRAPKLENSRYAVLSLGDSSYEFFCQTGKDFDQAFAKLGAQPLLERVDCDLDFEEQAENWIAQLVEAVSGLQGNSGTQSGSVHGGIESNESLNTEQSTWTKENPFKATVLANLKITGRGSVKHINHIEISLEGSGITYQPGDSLGVWAKNDSALVEGVLAASQLNGDEIISFKGKSKPLKQALTENLEITLLNKDFIDQVSKLANSDLLNEVVESNYAEYIQNHQVVDVLEAAALSFDAQQLVDLLKPIKPRMYSIASSLEANPEEVHLTVGLVKNENETATRFGAASHFLIDSLEEDDEVLVFVEPNKHFKLPEASKPTIMIGPGTGVAPFRAFLQERQEVEASGANWLFFGNPNFNTDFLYQVEFQEFLKEGLLTELSVAFSRDQEEKVYVQDRLIENAEKVWQWIDNDDASVYVCGDMSRMAKDVEQALLNIIEQQGRKTPEQAKEYLKALKKNKRYQRDVY